MSDRVTIWPADAAFAYPEQVLPPWLQLKVPGWHPAGAAVEHVALYGAPQEPLLQEAYALPVVGDTVSDKTAMAPFAALPAAALQALPATVQLNVVAGQLADGAG